MQRTRSALLRALHGRPLADKRMSRSDRRIPLSASGTHEDNTLSLGMAPAVTPGTPRGTSSRDDASSTADAAPEGEWRTLPGASRMRSASQEDGTYVTSSYSANSSNNTSSYSSYGAYSTRGSSEEGYSRDRRSTWDAGMTPGRGREPMMLHMYARLRAASALSVMQPLERLGTRSSAGSGGSYTYSHLSIVDQSQVATAHHSSPGSPRGGWSGAASREHHSASEHSAYHQSAYRHGHFQSDTADMPADAGRRAFGDDSAAVLGSHGDCLAFPPCDHLVTHKSDPTSTSASSLKFTSLSPCPRPPVSLPS